MQAQLLLKHWQRRGKESSKQLHADLVLSIGADMTYCAHLDVRLQECPSLRFRPRVFAVRILVSPLVVISLHEPVTVSQRWGTQGASVELGTIDAKSLRSKLHAAP